MLLSILIGIYIAVAYHLVSLIKSASRDRDRYNDLSGILLYKFSLELPAKSTKNHLYLIRLKLNQIELIIKL